MAQHYSVHELADLSGVSVRTLHHYDKIGLLVPGRAKNGYRLYGPKEVARLQLILLYRACGIELSRIGFFQKADEVKPLMAKYREMKFPTFTIER